MLAAKAMLSPAARNTDGPAGLAAGCYEAVGDHKGASVAQAQNTTLPNRPIMSLPLAPDAKQKPLAHVTRTLPREEQLRSVRAFID
jgi:hypothetical protein